MNPNLGQGSARIYQFPAGGRAALGKRRYEQARPNPDLASPRVHETACSESWYHAEAIREEEAAREH